MDYKLLSEVSVYRKDRISSDKVNKENYISTENMLSNRGGVESATTVASAKTFPAYKKGDILLSNIRPYFKKIWYADKEGGCSNDVLVVKAGKSVDSKFLYYVLSDNNFFNYSTVTSKGTKMPRGSKNAIMKYWVPDLDLPAQKKIADILSSYDELIKANNERIELLEQVAQELYKEWFVRFRFPGYENAKFEDGFPKGWTIKRLADYGRVETGKTPSTDVLENYGGEMMFVKTPDMHGNIFIIQTEDKLSERGHNAQPKKLLPANSIMVSCIGTAGVVSINAEPAHTNQQINSIILNNPNELEWLYHTCKSLKDTIELFGATGATMTNLSKGKFEKLKVVDPREDLILEYHNKVYPLFNEIKSLMYQNQNLAAQRDMLLPRLMSGKLEM